MRVWVLNVSYDFEGEETLGVFSSEAGALKAAAKKYARLPELTRDEKPKVERQEDGRVWIQFDGGGYLVAPYKVGR